MVNGFANTSLLDLEVVYICARAVFHPYHYKFFFFFSQITRLLGYRIYDK